PQIVANPTFLKVDGDFKQLGIEGIKFLLTLDHRTPNSKDLLEASVARYPSPSLQLSRGSVDISLMQATGSSQLMALYQNSQIHCGLNNEFTHPQFNVAAQSKFADEAISSILSSLNKVTLAASIRGPWNRLRFDVDSNLGKALSDGLRRYVKQKVDAMKLQ